MKKLASVFPMNFEVYAIHLMALFVLAACTPQKGSSERAPSAPAQAAAPTAPANSSNTEGGQDLGGGETFRRTPEEVTKAINEVWDLVQTDDDICFLAVRSATNQTQEMMEKICSLSVEKEVNGKKQVTSWSAGGAPAQYLPQSKLTIKQSDYCTSQDKKHAEASVTKFERGSPVCFSVVNFLNKSKVTLHAEILVLLFHEMAHLNGYGEAEALLVQETAERAFFPIVKSYLPVESIRLHFQMLDEIESSWKQWRKDNPDQEFVKYFETLEFKGSEEAKSNFKMLADLFENEIRSPFSSFSYAPKDKESFEALRKQTGVFQLFYIYANNVRVEKTAIDAQFAEHRKLLNNYVALNFRNFSPDPNFDYESIRTSHSVTEDDKDTAASIKKDFSDTLRDYCWARPSELCVALSIH